MLRSRPEVAYLDAPRLRRCLLAGLTRLISEREHLNRINVFPVPDGDTGNNLAQTAVSAHAALSASTGTELGRMLSDLADGALDGAQGNSGAMLAQFFQGLATALQGAERIDTGTLADALAAASRETRAALTHPREGTMITVMDAAAAAAMRHRRQPDFARALLDMLEATRRAVAATTGQLEELRRANVVDAGAQGFLLILEGCADYLSHGSLRQETPVPELSALPFSSHIHDTTDPTHRYCTECMVIGSGLDAGLLRQELEAHGDSLVIAGSAARLRVHIHTDEPESIFDLVAEFGTVSQTKADDMLGQARSLRRTNRDVAIVTDSAADIPDTLMQALDIHMVPLRVQFGTDSHLDKAGMSPAEFRAELQRNPERPGTSQPTQGDLRRMFEFLGTHFGESLAVSVSAALSGTHQGFCAAAGRATHAAHVRVVDSANASVGQGLAAVQAARLAGNGLRGDELAAAVTRECTRIRSFALVADLGNAVRSGRLPAWVKRVADALRLTPVLATTPAGKIGVSGFQAGRFNRIQRFARHVARRSGRGRRFEFAIAHGYREAADAVQLEQALLRLLPGSRCVWKTELGAALGVHAGMAALVVGLRDATDDAADLPPLPPVT